MHQMELDSSKAKQPEAEPVPASGIAPLEAMIPRRVAAYGFLFLAGLGVVVGAWVLILNLEILLQVLSSPDKWDFWIVLLPGLAAMLGAAAVHIPLMRAVRAGRKLIACLWVVPGVLAAHLAYALLLFAVLMGMAFLATQTGQLLPRTMQDPLMALQNAGEMGLISLILGGIPNLLIGLGFTGFLFWREARPPAQDTTQHSEGAQHAAQLP